MYDVNKRGICRAEGNEKREKLLKECETHTTQQIVNR